MKKYAFIINPTAGKVRKLNVSELILTESKKYDATVELFFTEYRGHAIQIAENLCSNDEIDFIISVGGDGTVNEIVNGFDLHSHKILGLLPFGSGNDASRYLYKSKKYLETIFRSQNKHLVEFDIGVCKITNEDETKIRRRFINAVGVGFDAYVAHLNQTGKKLAGVMSYVAAVFQALRSLTPLDINFNFGNEENHGKFLMMTIGNGKTSGGGFFLCPEADPTDKRLNLTTIDFTTRLEIIKKLPLALVNKLKKVDKARFYTSENFTIKLDIPYFVHLDGEIISRNAKDLSINLEENKLRIIAEK